MLDRLSRSSTDSFGVFGCHRNRNFSFLVCEYLKRAIVGRLNTIELSSATKASFISAIIFLLEHLKLIRFEQELIYLCVVSMFIYVRMITLFFKQYDPLMPFENFSSGILFNSWSEIVVSQLGFISLPSVYLTSRTRIVEQLSQRLRTSPITLRIHFKRPFCQLHQQRLPRPRQPYPVDQRKRQRPATLKWREPMGRNEIDRSYLLFVWTMPRKHAQKEESSPTNQHSFRLVIHLVRHLFFPFFLRYKYTHTHLCLEILLRVRCTWTSFK